MMLLCAVLVAGACNGGGGSNLPQDRGFDLHPIRIEQSQTTGAEINVPTVMKVSSQFIEPLGAIRGQIESFPTTEIGPAITQFRNAKVPAKWRFTYREFRLGGGIPCEQGVITVERNVSVGETEPLYCSVRVFPLGISPNVIASDSAPRAIKITAPSLRNDLGAPRIFVINEIGTVVQTLEGEIVSLAKGEVEFPSSSVVNLPNGVYQVAIHNVGNNDLLELIGVAQLSVIGNPPPMFPHIPSNPCAIPAPCLY